MSTTAAVFLVAFLAMAVMAFARSPMYGLYCYVAIFYVNPVDRWWGGDLPTERWSLLAGLIMLAATLRLTPNPDRTPWYRATAAGYLIAMTLWLWVQNLWALESAVHLEASVLFTKYVLLYYLMYRLLDSEEALWSLLRAHTLGCMFLGWLVLLAPDTGRLEGVGGPGINEANALGMQLATGSLAAGALLFHRSWWSRGIALACLPLILNGLVQTESRGAFLALVAGGLLFLYFSPARSRRHLVLLGIVGVALLIPRIPEQYWERLNTISAVTDESAEVDRSTEIRLNLFKAQWQMFLDYPMGSGHRGTASLSPRYLTDEDLTTSGGESATRARSSHSTYFTVLAEQGVPGVLLFATVCLWILRTARSVHKAILAGTDTGPGRAMLLGTAVGTLAVTLVAGLFTDYFKTEVFVWGLVMLGSLNALRLGAANRTAGQAAMTTGLGGPAHSSQATRATG